MTPLEMTPACTPGGISVIVRLIPLDAKEIAAWDVTDENTIVSKHLHHDHRGGLFFTFDKVFDPTCSTRKVYEEGVRDVVMSTIRGINATIFAYGQSTFTMRAVADDAIKDIYEHINITPERDFSLKFSAVEIYNENVVDLLNRESGCLRLFDDPKRGTIVDNKLLEEVVKDGQHLRHLMSICEASSRSHQIIRLTIESGLPEDSGCVKSLLASLNLVDLAGSERARLSNADDTWLKEQSHINRSLLTLTTVIRKLSGGKRSGHIPFRESKLTRILQTSLGGNARTAIIFTMSPALSHVDQSRNMLLFAKEVANSAKVNMIVEKKQLVKQLQDEVATLEAELRSPEPSSASSCLRSLLKQKDAKIQQLEREINELKRKRDLAQSQLEEINLRKRKRDLAQSQLELERSSCKEQKVLELGEDIGDDDVKATPGPSCRVVFGDQLKEIVMLWHICHASIVHRSKFYLIFKGELDDHYYMEVELRRLKWLDLQLDEVGNASAALLGDDPHGSVTSRIKALKVEREYLAKRVSSKLTAEEREMLYMKWEISLDGKQKRRLQLVNKLWTNPLDMQHVKESAQVVAKLVGFCEPSSQPLSRETFALNFAPLTDKKSWMGWNLISNLLYL